MPSATINVKDAAGATVAIEKPIIPGAAAKADSRPVGLSNEDVTLLTMQKGAGNVTATTLRTVPATDSPPITVIQGGFPAIWQIEGKTDGSGVLVPVHIDPAQLGALINGAVPVVGAGYEWKAVAASQSDVTLQDTTGVIGDLLQTLVCVVLSPATAQVLIGDGAAPSVVVLPNNPGPGIGTYHVALGIRSKVGPWHVATGSGVSLIATGLFT